MTISDFAAYLQVAKPTFNKLAQEGKLPGHKVGKHWRFSRDAVDKWIREGNRAPQESEIADNSRREGR